MLGAACGLDVAATGSGPLGAGSPDGKVPAEADGGGGGRDAFAVDAPIDGSGPSDGPQAVPSIVLMASPLATPPALSDLTAEGTVDWAHWGFPGEVVRKASGGNRIGDYVHTGTGGEIHDYDFGGWPMATSWTDGTPGHTSVTGSKTHQYFVFSSDVALTFRLPASQTPRTTILYLGGYGARGRLELSFDDAPATVTSDERENRTYYFGSRYEVRYSGSNASTRLVVKWKILDVYLATGTIIVSSIALR
jgi:hypothetical protein